MLLSAVVLEEFTPDDDSEGQLGLRLLFVLPLKSEHPRMHRGVKG